jgi:hypothetical protein
MFSTFHRSHFFNPSSCQERSPRISSPAYLFQHFFPDSLRQLRYDKHNLKKAAKMENKSPEKVMQDDIKRVQLACVDNQILHLSRCFTKAPGQLGVVSCFATCDDPIAEEVQRELDDAVRRVFADHGLTTSPDEVTN